jgi:chromate transporter
MAPGPAGPTEATVTPGVGGLFLGFLSVGVIGFGGVLPFARRMIVEQRRWLTAPEFTDVISLCQFLPGPNVINLSVVLGSRFRGVRGAIAGFLGLMAAPMTIIVVLGLVYERYAAIPAVRHMFAGLAAAASGLVIATSLRIAAPLRRDPPAVAIVAVTFAAMTLLRVKLLWAMLLLAPAGILVAALRRAR